MHSCVELVSDNFIATGAGAALAPARFAANE